MHPWPRALKIVGPALDKASVQGGDKNCKEDISISSDCVASNTITIHTRGSDRVASLSISSDVQVATQSASKVDGDL
jgi:hypothetical protein